MRKDIIAAAVALAVVFLFGKSSVFAADCIPATGVPLSCGNPSYTKSCSVRPSGGGAGVLYCCSTQAECDSIKAEKSSPPASTSTAATVCQYVNNDNDRNTCVDCVVNRNGTWTALGCIENDSSVLVSKLITLGIGIAGGIAFLLILFGGFQILISAGNPEKMNAGKEMVTSAITGLLLIIFSVFLLRLIGYDILHIPGFGIPKPQ
jgi:hypothetical protein